MNHQYNQLNYRPEIDGLRALAVLSVIFYHLNPKWISGGFLGVDIFFVISGYLITKIITNEMALGTFSFQNFYKRRIKRIFPVFILVMAIASIFGSLFFIRSEGELQRKGIEAGILFFSNFFLANRQGYWDLAANENPILHIWSLAVEEQYYLLFPLLLYIFYRRKKTHKTFIIVTFGLFLFFTLNYLLPSSFYSTLGLNNTYYASNLRFPELLIGSVLAVLKSKWQFKGQSAVGLVAFLILLSCLFLFHKDMQWLLNGSLLLPCILTAVLILAMETKDSLIKSLFASKPLVFIGKLSYSLYLFHWLFIAWAHYITAEKQLDFNVILIVFGLTFVCSLLSYFLLELPIRHSTLSFKKALLFIYIIPSVCVISYNLITKKHVMYRNDKYKEIPEFIVKTDDSLAKKVAVFGDSHAGHLTTFFNYIGNREGWAVGNAEMPFECHLPLTIEGNVRQECVTTLEQYADYPVVMISMFYDLKRNNGDLPRVTPREFFVEDFDKRFRELVAYFAKTKKVYVFADIKVADRSPLRAVFLQNYGLNTFLKPIGELGNKAASNEYIFNLIKDIQNVYWVDPTKYLPQDYFVQGIPLYSDQDHLSTFGSFHMAEQFHKYERLLSQKDVEELNK